MNIQKHHINRAIRVAVHVGSLLPLVILVTLTLTGNLSANPYQDAEQRSGDAALIMLLASLSCTPLNILFGFSQAIKHRRALGLYAFFYASLHLFIFSVLDYGLDGQLLWEMVRDNHYIIVGLAAFILLLVLAATSFKWWMKRLSKNWSRLHRVVYLAGVLVVLHFAWVVKGNVLGLSGNVARPIIAGLVLTFLLVVRFPGLRQKLIGLRRSVQQKIQLPSPGSSPQAGIQKIQLLSQWVEEAVFRTILGASHPK